MILDLNFPITGLDGSEIPNSNAGKIIAEILAMKADGLSAVKAMDAAIKFYNNESVDLEKDDLEKLKTVIEGASIANLVKAAAINAIDKTIKG